MTTAPKTTTPKTNVNHSSSPQQTRLPKRLGSYRLGECLGRGGMGEVFRAHHETLERDVAIKAIHESAIENEEHRERFRQEARLAARLNHPAIVQIYDLLELPAGDFIVMELVDGSPLRMLQRQRTLSVEEILEIGFQIAEALEVAHRQGIMHRDLKAENVMIAQDGRVKLLDFGLAKRFRLPDGDSVVEDEREVGQVLGTLRAMSPEQAKGHKLDGRSDLFSLGVLLYEVATGNSPFKGQGVADTLQQICSHYPPPVHRKRPDLPMDLTRILDHLMEKDPELRPQQASDVAKTLKEMLRLFSEEESGPLSLSNVVLTDSETGWVSSDLHDPTVRAGQASAGPMLPGRGTELMKLGSAWQQALQGIRQVVFVSGEPGIGKSTLVGRFAQSLKSSGQDLASAEGRCLELHGSQEAYLPIIEALGRLCRGQHGRAVKRVLLQWAPSWLIQMPWVVEDDERDRLIQRTLGAGPARRLLELLEALDALSRRRPLLLVIEDLHWSDLSTLELLSALSQRIESARLMVICTLRNNEKSSSFESMRRIVEELSLKGDAQEIALGLLPPDDMKAMLLSHHPDWKITPEVSELVHRHAGGNPLFSIHLADMLLNASDSGTLDLSDDAGLDPDGDLLLSQTLFRILESLLQRASREEQWLLEVASLAGERFILPVVAAAAEVSRDTCERVLDGLAKSRSFLRRLPSIKLEDGRPAKRYAFLHNIYRRALRRRISSETAARCHRALAEAIQEYRPSRGGSLANELALHYELAGCPEQALTQYDQAAEVALSRGAYGAAVENVRRAEGILESIPDSSALTSTKIGLNKNLGLALFATRGYSVQESGLAFERAEALCQELDDPRLFYVRCGRWVYHLMRAEVPKAIAIAEEAQRQIAAQPQAGPYARLISNVILAASYMRRGDFQKALDFFTTGLELSESIDQREVFQSFPLVEGRVFGRVFGALTLWYLGRGDEAKRWALEGCRLANEMGHAFSSLNASSISSTLFLLCGDTERSRELHQKAVTLSEEHGYALSLAPMIRQVIFEPNPAAAASRLDMLEKKVASAQRRGDLLLQNVDMLLLAHARRQAGRLENAFEALQQGIELVEKTDDRWYEAELYRLQGDFLVEMEGAFPEIRHRAEDSLRKAFEIAGAQGAKAWQLRTACSLVNLHKGSTAAQESLDLLSSVLGGFDQGYGTADYRIAQSLLAQRMSA